MLIGALELSTNQITHFYVDRKNTSEMTRLLHMLLSPYKDQERFSECVHENETQAKRIYCSKFSFSIAGLGGLIQAACKTRAPENGSAAGHPPSIYE